MAPWSIRAQVLGVPATAFPGPVLPRTRSDAVWVPTQVIGQRSSKAWRIPALSRPRRPVRLRSLQSDQAASQSEDGGALKQVLLFLTYLVAQTGLNVYMKWLVSKAPVVPGLKGVPASFLITGIQQLTAFVLFMGLLVGSRLLPGFKPYSPRSLRGKERLLVIVLALAFSLNVGLNNFSLVLIPLSINLIIRACLPLSTAVSQTLIRGRQDISLAEWGCMIAGVCCAGVTVLAKIEGRLATTSALFFGIIVCILSTFSGAVDLVMKNVLGSDVKLSAIDSMCYMSIPAFFFLLVPGCFWAHPTSSAWATALGSKQVTDLAVLSKVAATNPGIIGLAVLSGLVAFGYNVLTTFLAVQLSPATTSFAGNFNKAAGILFSLLVLEGSLPKGHWGPLLLTSVLGNIAAFVLYNNLRGRKKRKG